MLHLSLDCSLIRILYRWVLSKEVSSTIFKVFGMTRPGLQDHWQTLYPLGQWVVVLFKPYLGDEIGLYLSQGEWSEIMERLVFKIAYNDVGDQHVGYYDEFFNEFYIGSSLEDSYLSSKMQSAYGVGNGHGDPSSNPGRGCLHFTNCPFCFGLNRSRLNSWYW